MSSPALHRLRRPRWLRIGWDGHVTIWQRAMTTFAFAVVVAIGFTLIGRPIVATSTGALVDLTGWWQWFEVSLLISLAIGFSIQALFELVFLVVGPPRMQAITGWKRGLLHGSISMTGGGLGVPLGRWLASGLSQADALPGTGGTLVSSLVLAALVTGVMLMFFAAREARLDSERRATDAQLKLLQGQIEPHFLFNTLANVLVLIERDTPRAKAMLESFVDYLRSSLGSLRHESHTLGDELALVEAYLKIVQIRMDDRLAFTIDVPDALRAAPLPALTVQPLVENAIRHGLEPKIEPGRVTLRAARDARGLVVTVQDDGLGLQAASPNPGSGTALRNIRERLQQRYGAAARLEIEAASPDGRVPGTIARLTLP